MTRTGGRAKNIRKLTREDVMNLQPKGGFANESLPSGLNDLLKRMAPDLSRADFLAWLGPRLGVYRMLSDASNQPSQVRYELRITEETGEVIRELIRRLQCTPERIAMDAFAVLRQLETENWDDTEKRAVTMLRNLDSVLLLACRKTSARPRAVGRKPKSQRDALVRDVVSKLAEAMPQAEQTNILEVAYKTLTTCKVSLPSDPEDFRKLC